MAASQATLARLPGLTDEDAARIIANRPYGKVSGIQDYVYVTK
jgi:hypothetical protein